MQNVQSYKRHSPSPCPPIDLHPFVKQELNLNDYIVAFRIDHTWPSLRYKHLTEYPSIGVTDFVVKESFNGYRATISQGMLAYVQADTGVVGSDKTKSAVPARRRPDRVSDRSKKQQEQINAEEDARMAAPQTIWTGRNHVVGLRAPRDLQQYVSALPVNMQELSEQYIPTINGYIINISLADEEALDTIRKDGEVGFVVLPPRGHFSPFGWKGLGDPDDPDGYNSDNGADEVVILPSYSVRNVEKDKDRSDDKRAA
ncbi:hypothetical protein E4T39_07017 [Aureobasidium subglaciale]|nr:hypothetical protein E4T39_07017 [Aureobasidium subglaciale]